MAMLNENQDLTHKRRPNRKSELKIWEWNYFKYDNKPVNVIMNLRSYYNVVVVDRDIRRSVIWVRDKEGDVCEIGLPREHVIEPVKAVPDAL